MRRKLSFFGAFKETFIHPHHGQFPLLRRLTFPPARYRIIGMIHAAMENSIPASLGQRVSSIRPAFVILAVIVLTVILPGAEATHVIVASLAKGWVTANRTSRTVKSLATVPMLVSQFVA